MSTSKKKIISGYEFIINKKGQVFVRRRVGFKIIDVYYYRYKL